MVNYKLIPTISPELKFVLSCTYNVGKKIEEPIPTLDWNKVLSLAISHGIFPLVYNTLSKLNNTNIPEFVLQSLQQQYLKNAIKVVGLAEEICRITNYMEQNDVQPIILKGPPLSIKTNEDIALRPSSDIDILVDPTQFDKAEKLLEELEYKRFSPDFTLTPRQKKFCIRNDHHFEYIHYKRAIIVELHWRIRSDNIKNFPTASALTIQKVLVSERPITVMDNEYWLIYLMVHGYKHMWERLRWLYDIKQLMHYNLDWNKVIFIADKSELRSILHQTLILLNILYDVSIPDMLNKSTQNDKKAWQLSDTVLTKLGQNINVNELITISHLKNTNYYNYNSRLIHKLFYIFLVFKPTIEDFKQTSLPDILFPLYYVLKFIYYFRKTYQEFFFIKRK